MAKPKKKLLPRSVNIPPQRFSSRATVDKGNTDRLKDQLKVYDALEAIHLNRRRLDEMAFYPAHDARTETPQYRAVHKHLVTELDLPCLICGVKQSILADPAKAKSATTNPYGAKAMETHHHVIEWSLANAIDPAKFNNTLLPHLRQRHKDNPDYSKPFTEQQVHDWVDHSADNLWVLCDVHHRAKFFGIHSITFPIWGPMDMLKPDFDKYVKEQIDKARKESPPK